MGGLKGSQTVSVFGTVAIACTNRGLVKMSHLSWFESLGEQTAKFNGSEWIKMLKKLQSIYLGKISGFRVQTQEET